MTAPRPVRLQLSRRNGFNLQALSLATNGLPAVNVARPGKHGNPFRVGRWFRLGDSPNVRGPFRFVYSECLMPEVEKHRQGYTLIETNEQAVDWFRRYRQANPLSPTEISALRGHNLACFCHLTERFCHADVLLESCLSG